MRKNWPVIVIALLLAMSVAAFLTLYEQFTESRWVGYEGEARTQPFLAAQRFLEANGVAISSDATNLDFTTISTDKTVFLSSLDSMIVSAKHVDQALDWVDRGGYLIAAVGQKSEGAHSLLDTFGVTPEIASRDGGFSDWFEQGAGGQRPPSEVLKRMNEEIKRKKAAREKQGKESPDSIDALSKLLDVETREYEISLSGGNLVRMEVLDQIVLRHPNLNGGDDDEGASEEDNASGDYESNNEEDAVSSLGAEYQIAASASDESGAKLLQVDYGDGVVTFLSSDKLWRNQNIDKAEHAYFLDYLVPAGSSMLIFYNINVPGLWSLLKQHFFEVLIAATLLIGLWVWQKAVRTRPLQVAKVDAHRNFYEHLSAGVNFLLRHRQFSALTEPLKEDVWQAIQARRPEFASAAAGRQIALLASEVETSQEAIKNWLNLIESCKNEEEFTTIVKMSNWIRKKL